MTALGDAPSVTQRDALRQSTRPLHQRLDSHPALSRLLRAGIRAADYVDTLQRLEQAYRASEAELSAHDRFRPLAVPPYLPRLPSLRADIAGLTAQFSLEPTRAAIPATASRRTGTPSGSTGYYLGLRYVLEGATQGSRIIAAQLRRHHPELLATHHAYWDHQAQVTPHWSIVCHYLDTTPLCITDITHGAQACYHHFLSAIEQ